MQHITYLPRGYQNLRAYRAATSLCRDLFWLSRRFPSRLDRSLKNPMRRHARCVTHLIADIWRNRTDHAHVDVPIEGALDELWTLRQYLLRAQEEELITADIRDHFERHIRGVECHVRRLRRKLTVAPDASEA